MKYGKYFYEKIRSGICIWEIIAKSNKYIENCITIIDIKDIGVNFIVKNMKYAKMGGKITQNYYPENLAKMYVINANTLFSTLWSLVKNFIDEKTQQKISVYKDDYLKHLLETIPIENLPKFLGGTCECKEGCMNSNAGVWNYESIQLINNCK